MFRITFSFFIKALDRFEKVAFIWSTFSSDSCFPSALSGRSVCASLAVTAYRHGGGKKRRFLGLFFFSPAHSVEQNLIKSHHNTVVACVVQWWRSFDQRVFLVFFYSGSRRTPMNMFIIHYVACVYLCGHVSQKNKSHSELFFRTICGCKSNWKLFTWPFLSATPTRNVAFVARSHHTGRGRSQSMVDDHNISALIGLWWPQDSGISWHAASVGANFEN